MLNNQKGVTSSGSQRRITRFGWGLPILTFIFGTLIVAGSPIQSAQSIGGLFGGVTVVSKTKTLPADGTDVTFTLKARSDLILMEILMDNSPTRDAQFCTPGSDRLCQDSDFRLLSLTVDGVGVRPGQNPRRFANDDNLSLRGLLSTSGMNGFQNALIPLNKGQQLVLTFDTQNGNNQVKLKVTAGVLSGGAPLFY